ncbi:MAG: hypothetical protein GTO40_02400 [Deltaproteobacteria bacterium]|nr:hypothetical protein [Deltaproteobacteria bacterium]
MIHWFRKIFVTVLFLVVFSVGSMPNAGAQKRMPDATASITLTSLAFIGGVEWGKGELHYKGKNYTFKVKGLKAGAIGIKRDSVHAKIFYLKKPTDLGGTFVAGEAAATIAGGGSARIMKNQNGVEMHLFSVTMGADFTLAAEGLNVRMDK